ncbi:isoaspartyl peptidase/L-asparaginase [Candidatus Borrarchaeum sp.]|uniref:isoaspartyl peptidase/L-asparaginase n=1 Tax=Candidatus Borrarchaeum sp. TaxID=2846742 RepID=UPI00257C0405|nr:isoaspartyl peptidase/L-asparaginase [Candidatus Borrarchaeum sp.]
MPAIVVHGGAWDVSRELVGPNKTGISHAAIAGIEVLKAEGNALDAVEAAIRILEDDDSFNAGIGSVLTLDGHIEMDAAIMDGKTLKAGAVGSVSNVRHPISLARKIAEETIHVFLVGKGADDFARAVCAQEVCSFGELVVERRKKLWEDINERMGDKLVDGYLKAQVELLDKYPLLKNVPLDTVGAVAIDKNGDIAAGTSTGGMPMKLSGRIGDSPLIGCGTYADNDSGGVSATGHGESIIKTTLAKTTCDLIERGHNAQKAADVAIDFLWTKIGGKGGVIVIDKNGNVGLSYNTTKMPRAWMNTEMSTPEVTI